LNHAGDQEPSFWKDGAVTPTKGFKEAFRAYADAGWQGVQHLHARRGHQLGQALAAEFLGMLHGANLAFALVALLSDGAIEALLTAGSD
ncbi:hypothetical protein KQ738_16695, partial [Listeria monocytogenes]|nr:hypothetical protein [Listeria monocytogenes]